MSDSPDFEGYGVPSYPKLSKKYAPKSYIVNLDIELLFDTEAEAEDALKILENIYQQTASGVRKITIGKEE